MKQQLTIMKNGTDIYLEEDVASLDEVVLVADNRPKTGNDIMVRTIERLPNNFPEEPYLQKDFYAIRNETRKSTSGLLKLQLPFMTPTMRQGQRIT